MLDTGDSGTAGPGPRRGAGAGGREPERELRHAGYEGFIVLLTLLSLVNLVLVAALPPSETTKIVLIVDSGLTLVFLGDFAYRVHSTPHKREYLVSRWGWLDLLGSLPIAVLPGARLLRIPSVVRLLRRYGPRRLWEAARRDRAGTTLLSVVFLAIVLLEVQSAVMLAIESQHPGTNIRTASDALWWTFVSVATVGYGDRYPVSETGRLVGVITVTLGVGLFGTLSGYLANAFLRHEPEGEPRPADPGTLAAELAALRAEVRALRALQGGRSEAADEAEEGESARG